MAVFILLLRLPKIARCYGSIWNTPFAWAAGAYLAWMTLGLLWAPDAYLGLELLGTQRMLLIPLLLWPVLAHVRVLALSFLAGVFVLNGIQLVQWVTEEALRVEGTNNAIKTGLYCGVAACAWAQIAVATCRHRYQLLVSLAAMLVALVGLVLSGSRGPIAAVVLSLPLLAAISFALYPMLRRRIVLVACILCIGAGFIGALKW
ncbi:MAG: hypothetical protein MK095_06705, partial [Phycisphaerales bacterium]|nr:hypothetical protein [Phycisphaerales bacterium]